MSTSDKPNAPESIPGTDVESDVIVLSTGDQTTPAALVVDENGLLDIDKLSSAQRRRSKRQNPQRDGAAAQEDWDEAEDEDEDEAQVIRPSRRPIEAILKVLRWPEQRLIDKYLNSKFSASLRSRFEWYRELEGERQLNNKLEDLYGGTNKPLHGASRFIRNNILVSLTLIAVTGQLLANYLSTPVQKRYQGLDSTEVVDADSAGAATSGTSVTEVDEKPNYLNHCAVSSQLRHAYEDDLEHGVQPRVQAEINRFIETFEQSNIENWFTTRLRKRETALTHLQSTLPLIRNYLQGVSQEVANLTEEYRNAKSQMQVIDVTTKVGINQAIRARDQLLDLQARVELNVPVSEAISAVNSELRRLDELMQEDSNAAPSAMSSWAVATSQEDLTTFTSALEDMSRDNIYASVDSLSSDSLATKQYKLLIMAGALRDFGDLIAHLSDNSSHALISVGEAQKTSNRKLRKLLDLPNQPDSPLLNFDNCLTALLAANASVTMQFAW